MSQEAIASLQPEEPSSSTTPAVEDDECTRAEMPPASGQSFIPGKARNLVVCIDGTSNKFSEKSTNVVELCSHLEKNDVQLTYYNSGVGTYARPSWRGLSELKKIIGKGFDLIVAWSFENDIMAAYSWLADNYRAGDKIFLFGFSRGAYQVRVLAAMIHSVGLIYPGNKQQIPFAWELYASDDPGVGTFKETFSRPEVDLHFLGAWDTVSAIGIRLSGLLPLTNECCEYITHTRQALALDERRARFLPEYMLGLPKDGGTKKEVWFAGTHSDIGGGNKANPKLDLGAEPLKWMMDEARAEGLLVRLHTPPTGIPGSDITESLKHVWWACEYFPISRRAYEYNGRSYTVRWRLHRGRGRKVIAGQYIHWSVWTGLKYPYDPPSDNASVDNPTIGDRQRKQFKYKPKAFIKPGADNETGWDNLAAQMNLLSTDSDDKEINYPRGPVGWEGGSSLLRAIELINSRPSKMPPLAAWQDRLYTYLTDGQGKPDLIWCYGGPRLLHDLMNLPDRTKTNEIIRMTLGIQSDTTSPGHRRPPSAWGNRQSVVDRIFTILMQWTADDPLPTPTRPPNRSRLSGFRLRISGPNKMIIPTPWGLECIKKDQRSVTFAVLVTEMLLDLMKPKALANNPISLEHDQIEVILSLIPPRPNNGSADQASLTENALKLIVDQNINGRLIEQHSWHGLLSYALEHLGDHTIRESLIDPTIQAIGTFAQDDECAHTIVSHHQFSNLVKRLDQKQNEASTPQKDHQMAATRSTVSVIAVLLRRQLADRETLNKSLGQHIGDLIHITEWPEYPSSSEALHVIEYLCREGLVEAPSSEDTESNLHRVILRMLDMATKRVPESLVAMNVLVTLASHGKFIADANDTHITWENFRDLFANKSTEVLVGALTLATRLMEHNALPHSVLQQITPELATLMTKTGNLSLSQSALSVVKFMALHHRHFDPTLMKELVGLSENNGDNGDIAAAILWTLPRNQDNLEIPGNLHIPSLKPMLDGEDAWLALNAMHGLAQIAGSADKSQQLIDSDIIPSLVAALTLQPDKTPEIGESYPVHIIQKTYPLIKNMLQHEGIREALVRSGIAKYMRILNGKCQLRLLVQRGSSVSVTLIRQLFASDALRDMLERAYMSVPVQRNTMEQLVSAGLELVTQTGAAIEPARRKDV